MGDYFQYYAGLADKVQSAVIPTDKKGVFAYTRYEPKGVVAIITPWNSPLTLTSWKLAPALAAGCTAVIKPSEFTSASMLEFARLFDRGGLSRRASSTSSPASGPRSARRWSTHPDGGAHRLHRRRSTAGRKIYELAARGFKTVTLELGGKSPNIVFDDADLDQAVKGVVSGIFAATGSELPGRIAAAGAARHPRPIRRQAGRLHARTAKLGDPPTPDTQIGPIATRPQFEKMLSYIEIAKEEGAAACSAAGAAPDLGAGQFVEPTIFTDVKNSMRIAQEEVFGPVLAVIPFEDEADAIAIGNDVGYGLAAAVWTHEPASRHADDRQAARPARCGSTTTAPPASRRRSAATRTRASAARSGIETIKEYLHTKCVWISSDLDVPNPFVRR